MVEAEAEAALDPITAFDEAPADDRRETDEERAAVAAAKASSRWISHGDVASMIDRWRSGG